MRNNTTSILSPFILIPSFHDLRVQANVAMLEQCSLLCSVRDFKSVSKIAEMVSNPAGRLYETIATNNYSDPEAFIIKNIDDNHLAQMMLCVAVGLRGKGDLLTARKLLIEVLSLAKKHNDIVTTYQAKRELAILYSLERRHDKSLDVLESSSKLARKLYNIRPTLYFAHFNSMAVELCEIGELDKARHCIDFALASPFASAYPEWFETRLDILMREHHPKSRSFLAVEQVKVQENIVPLPTGERASHPVDEPGKLLTFAFRDVGKLVMEDKAQNPKLDQNVTQKRREIVDFLYKHGEEIGLDSLESFFESLKRALPKREEKSEI